MTGLRPRAATPEQPEELFKMLAVLATDVITCRGPDGTFTYVSPSVKSVLGWQPEELIGAVPEVLWHPEDLARGRELLATLEAGVIARIEWRARRPDDSFVWCESTGRKVVHPETGKAEYWGAMRDISDRRRAEERYRLLAELCPEPVLVHDAGTIVYANPALATLAGASSPEQIMGRTLESLVVPEAMAGVAARARAVIEEGATIRAASTVGRRLDGTTVDLEVSAAPFPLDGRTGSLVVLRDVTATRHAALALAASEARYRKLVDNLTETAVFVYDRYLRVVMAAGPALAAVGLDPGELVGRRAQEVLPRADFAILEPRFALGLSGEPSTVEYQAARSGLHYIVDVTPLENGEGGIEGIQVVARNTTRLRQSERAARTASARYASAVGSAPIGVAMVGLDGRYVAVNQALCDMVGYTAEELKTTTVTAITAPRDRQRAEAALSAIVSGQTREYRLDQRYLHADGRVVWANVNAIVVDDEQGQPDHLLVFIVDLSERVRGEALIKESEERFRVLAEASTEGVCIGENRVVISANAAMATMYGYDPDELIGLPVETLLAPEYRAVLLQNVSDRGDVRAELVGVRKDGTRFPMVATGRSVSYRGRAVRVTTVTDLTDQKRSATLEERRRIARDLHDGLAHELAFISSKAKSLRRQLLNVDELNQLVSAAERALDEARRAISVLSSVQGEQLSVALAQTAEDLTARHGVALELELDPALSVAGDVAENLLRILREAITNAARHGGATKIAVHGWRDGAFHLIVEDNGCGFDPDLARGGFGLASMRERAQAVGAILDVRSALGDGARIEVVVP